MALVDRLRALQRNTLDGLWLGLAVALGFSAWVTFQYVRGHTRVMDELHVGYGAVIGTYFVAGLVGGTLYGALKPLRRYTLGVMVVAFICAALAYGLIGLAVEGPARWSSEVPPFALFGGTVAALFFGLDDAWGKFKRRRAAAPTAKPPAGAA